LDDMSDTHDKWEAFLNPEVLRGRLISCSLYLAGYELLKDSIIERIKEFYSVGFDQSGLLMDDSYKTKVLSKSPSPLYASLQWLRENDVIDVSDLAQFEQVRECRNAVAHELPQILGGSANVDYVGHFGAIATLLRKIEVWWLVNVEIATDPDLVDKEVDEAGIVPGPIITLQLMLDVALGEPDKASYYLDEFRKMRQRRAGGKPR
jgi:hypothetical protein